VDIGQVGVIASYYHTGVWTLVDAELCLPESWVEKEKKRLWKRLHIPLNREFARKLDIAEARIDHAGQSLYVVNELDRECLVH
jgi:hypothetical protein